MAACRIVLPCHNQMNGVLKATTSRAVSTTSTTRRTKSTVSVSATARHNLDLNRRIPQSCNHSIVPSKHSPSSPAFYHRYYHPSFCTLTAISASNSNSNSNGNGNSNKTMIRTEASPRSGALGSSLGTDSSMIAANNRCISSLLQRKTSTSTTSTTTTYSEGPHKNTTLLVKKNHDSPRLLSSQKRTLSSAAAAAPAESGAMQDEYGEMNDDGYTFIHSTAFELESGQVLPEAQLRYQTYGDLNEARDNVLVVCHALTGNASLHAWWGDLLGPGKAFDTDRYFVVCCNILGSCYGSTNPTSINPKTGKPYGKDFPDISVKDTVRLQLEMLVKELKVKSIKAVIGGSFGGMQAVEFAVQAGSSGESPFAADCYFTSTDDEEDHMVPLVRSVIPIACGAYHTAWQIAISETQRQAIYADPNWATDGMAATNGLAIARQIGMVSYRTPKGYCLKFGRDMQTPDTTAKYGSAAPWKVKSYLSYQGKKFLSRFDPITYVKMTEQMDSHDVTRGRGQSLEEVLGYVEIPSMVLGIDSDVLYPLSEQQELAEYLPNGELRIIHSDDGHDGFLLEQEQVAHHITDFLEKHV